MPDRINDTKWLNQETRITREQLANIISDEISDVLVAARRVGDRELYNFLQDLLLEYSASIATRIFDDKTEEELR